MTALHSHAVTQDIDDELWDELETHSTCRPTHWQTDNKKRFPTEMRIKTVEWTELVQDQISSRLLYL